MNRPTTAERDLLAFSALPSDAVLPAHLRGSREAIFHLLRQASAPNEPPRARSDVLPGTIQPHSTIVRKQTLDSPARSTGLQGYLQEDQFEFLSADARGSVVRSFVASQNRMAS